MEYKKKISVISKELVEITLPQNKPLPERQIPTGQTFLVLSKCYTPEQ